MTEVNLDAKKLVTYLTIAHKQRLRALQKFQQDYGPTSATVNEVNAEIAELQTCILDLQRTPTPLEVEANKNKK